MTHQPPAFAGHNARPAEWTVQPKAERLLRGVLDGVLARTPVAAAYAQRLHDHTGVRLRDLLDHFTFDPAAPDAVLGDWPTALTQAGWTPLGEGVWRHLDGWFPDFVEGEALSMAFRCESVERFIKVNGLDAAIEGAAHGPYRRAQVFVGDGAAVLVVERNGHAAYDLPRTDPALIRRARLHQQSFRARRRQFDTPAQGLDHTEGLVRAAVADIGPHWACDLFLRAEREYWMSRCEAGAFQKTRQDALGVGWSNIDHHTYDSDRAHFRQTIRILELLGFECRELLYAGALSGWGSQVLEQPVLRSTIFADVDLAPEEVDIDFAHMDLAPLDRRRRCGLWCGMHGESMLEAGLNHVAGLYDQVALRAQLNAAGVTMMSPFSDFPFLYQELTLGQWRAVDPVRIDALEAGGHITAEEAEEFRLNGAIDSHLENIERNDGYKGFNKPGIDGVLRKLDPRKNRLEDAAP